MKLAQQLFKPALAVAVMMTTTLVASIAGAQTFNSTNTTIPNSNSTWNPINGSSSTKASVPSFNSTSRQTNSTTTSMTSQQQQQTKVLNRTMMFSGDDAIQANASIFMPTFLGRLLNRGNSNGGQRPNRGEPMASESEDEEVTQTIEVPIGPREELQHLQRQQHRRHHQHQHLRHLQHQHQQQHHHQMQHPLMQGNHPAVMQHEQHSMASMGMQRFQNQPNGHPGMAMAGASKGQLINMKLQPSPEASLQLSSSELGGILNDRDAPDFYKEREFQGDGVVIGEEPNNRLKTAASASSGFGAPGLHFGQGSSFGGVEGASAGFGAPRGAQRLEQSASMTENFAGANQGFAQRFGMAPSVPYGAGTEGPDGYMGHTGGLMQSPNEYSEHSSAFGGGHTGQFGGQFHDQTGAFGAGGDYNAGLMRGASGELGDGDVGGAGFGHHPGAFGQEHHGQHMLDRHASELHGGHLGGAGGGFGAYGGGDSSSFVGGFDGSGGFAGRLAAEGSHHGGYPGTGGFGSGGFGGAGMYGGGQEQSDEMALAERGFAPSSQSFASASSIGAFEGPISRSGAANAHRLMPLMPTLPTVEEVGSPSQLSRSVGATPTSARRPEVHEPFDEEAAREARDEQLNGVQSPGYSPSRGTSSGMMSNQGEGDQDDEQDALSSSAPGSSNGGDGYSAGDHSGVDAPDESPSEQSTSTGTGGHSLVLNLPPPMTAAGDSTHSTYHRPGVEFTRLGSAGYLGPKRHSGAVERSGGQSQLQQSTRKLIKKLIMDSPGDRDQDEHRGANNPAHAGKFIIE